MTEFEIGECSLSPEAVEAVLVAQGLVVSLRTTLRAYPGGIHWHLKSPGEPGTLELTRYEGRLWFKIAANREAEWMRPAIMAFKAEIENLK